MNHQEFSEMLKAGIGKMCYLIPLKKSVPLAQCFDLLSTWWLLVEGALQNASYISLSQSKGFLANQII